VSALRGLEEKEEEEGDGGARGSAVEYSARRSVSGVAATHHTATQLGKTPFMVLISALKYAATHCNRLHHTATHLSKKPSIVFTAFKYTATHCNTLQHT